MIIRPSFDKDLENFMISRGLDKIILANKKMSFELTDSITPFKPSIDNVKSKLIGEAPQLKTATNLLTNPYKSKGVHVINSFPSDLRAKIFAACVMHKACEIFKATDSRKMNGKAAPLWVRAFGGYGNVEQLNQLKASKPSLLIISNICNEATPAKIEKLRDMLDIMDDIPRIVVTGGEDPVSLFARRLHYPIVGAIRLGCNEKVNLMDM